MQILSDNNHPKTVKPSGGMTTMTVNQSQFVLSPQKQSKLQQHHPMAGNKRSWEGNPVRVEKTQTNMAVAPVDQPSTHILSMFETFRDELDQHHDRRERVIKTSRDITALSKKMLVPCPVRPVCIHSHSSSIRGR
jgi:hypothetical protein